MAYGKSRYNSYRKRSFNRSDKQRREYAQAMSRIKRLGQENDIEYTYFTSNLGIYNMINENITKKQTLKELIVDKIEKGENFEKNI